MRPIKKSLGTFTLAMLTVAAIISLRNLPISALYGTASIFYFLLAALVFLIPIALVTAELATGWPEAGGSYLWVSQAFGKKWGFFTLWSAWMESIAWFPSILAFIASMLAYTLAPLFPQLPSSKLFHFVTIIIVFWGATFLNFRGTKTSGFISSMGVLLGTLIPGMLIISLGILWVIWGKPLAISLHLNALLPSFQLDTMVLFSGILLGLAGVELAAFHIVEAKNPQKDYPRALLIAVIIILSVSILGSLAIAVVVPQKDINLISGIMQAFQVFFSNFGMEKYIPLLSALLVIGSLAGVNTWTLGPAKGLLVTAQDGLLPEKLQKINKNGIPVNLLILQALIGSLLSLVFLWADDTSAAFWIITGLSAQFTVIQYSVMLIAALRLRYTKPHIKRAFTIPFGNYGIWITVCLGLLGCLFGFVIVFIPPQQLVQCLATPYYVLFLIVSLVTLLLPPIFFSK